MATRKSIIVLGNPKCTLVPKAPLRLAQGIIVSTLSNEEIGVLLRKYPAMESFINGQSKGIHIDNSDDNAHSDAYLAGILAPAIFSLNAFSEEGGLVANNCFCLIRKRNLLQVERRSEVGTSSAVSQAFKLSRDVDPRSIGTMFAAIKVALNKAASLRITMSRYNAAMYRPNKEDKIIELSICLESIFGSETEISFKFAVFNTLLAEADIGRRYQTFSLLRRLYSTRSKLVHGEIDEAELTTPEMERISTIAKNAILKKVQYLNEDGSTAEGWKKYLNEVVLGIVQQAAGELHG